MELGKKIDWEKNMKKKTNCKKQNWLRSRHGRDLTKWKYSPLLNGQRHVKRDLRDFPVFWQCRVWFATAFPTRWLIRFNTVEYLKSGNVLPFEHWTTSFKMAKTRFSVLYVNERAPAEMSEGPFCHDAGQMSNVYRIFPKICEMLMFFPWLDIHITTVLSHLHIYSIQLWPPSRDFGPSDIFVISTVKSVISRRVENAVIN